MTPPLGAGVRARRATGGMLEAQEGATGTRTDTGEPQGDIRPTNAQEPRKRQESALERHLAWSIRTTGLPNPEREYRFHPVRRWRLDFAWPAVMLAVEVEGGIYRGGGHTHVKDLKRDMEKSNALALAGWRLLRFHGDQVKSGEALAVIRQALDPAAEAQAGQG